MYEINIFWEILNSFPILFVLIICTFFTFQLNFKSTKIFLKCPPSPLCLPIIGHMYILAKYPTNAWLGFNEIRRKYGDIVSLKIGKWNTILVSSPEVMKKVIRMNAFIDRPDFYRFGLFFDGDRDKSLTFSDWNDLQKNRRLILQTGIMTKHGSKFDKRLSACIESEVRFMINDLIGKGDNIILNKNNFQANMLNIFLDYMCSKKIPNNSNGFLEAIDICDYIFFDINRGYVNDFLPFLSYFRVNKSYLDKVKEMSTKMKDFVDKEVIEDRLEVALNRHKNNSSEEYEPQDLLDLTINNYIENKSTKSWDHVLYEISNLIGGHSSVGNLLMFLIGFLILNPSVQNDLYLEAIEAIKRKESEQNGEEFITLEDRPFMPLTDASILETLRLVASPIVPHFSREDTTLQDFHIEKGTMVFFNVYHVHTSGDYWSEPEQFKPSRFVTENGIVSKPDYFFPFSSGRRGCLGINLVLYITFTVISNLVLNFEISAPNDEQRNTIKQKLVTKGCLGLDVSDKCFKVMLKPRKDINNNQFETN